MLIGPEPTSAPAAEAVMARAGTENFPVALRLLPRRLRRDLLAIYGFARLADELGDSLAGDRLAALDWLQTELDRAFAGEATHPLLIALQPTLRERRLPRGPFLRLIEANRVDQRVQRYATWEELRGYCALSADPVGELVLGVLAVATPERVRLSDQICTGLQLVEHCQDVAEDHRAGRVYLPLDEMEDFGCTVEQLGAPHAPRELRELLAFQVVRANTMFDAGAPLIDQLRGRPRIAVAAFLAGGRAAAGAIERAGFDVLPGPPRARSRELLRALIGTLAARRRRRERR
jgi:squalene synthase HpnC